MQTKANEIISGILHLVGVFLSIAGLVVLVVFAALKATVWHVVSFSIYGACMILLYLASTIYHLLPINSKAKTVFKKIDHTIIYIFIASVYTPICLVPLRGPWGWSIFGVIWAVAISGVILKIFPLELPRFLSAFTYVIMGWLALIAFYPMVKTMPYAAIMYLIVGGAIYTIGALIYALKWPSIVKKFFGFHEVWHLFVIGGSVLHFILMIKYILYLR